MDADGERLAFMNQLIKNASGGGKSAALGPAQLMKTQQWAASKWQRAGLYADLNTTESIFGDPAMPVMSNTVPAKSTGSGNGVERAARRPN